jgi:hypothetical protein
MHVLSRELTGSCVVGEERTGEVAVAKARVRAVGGEGDQLAGVALLLAGVVAADRQRQETAVRKASADYKAWSHSTAM